DRAPGALDLLNLGATAHVALLEGHLGLQEGEHDLSRHLDADDPPTQAQHVDVIVLDALVSGVGVVDGRRPHATDLGRGHRYPHAGPADDDPPLRAAGGDRLADLQRLVRIVDRVGPIGAEVQDLVAIGGDHAEQPVAQHVSGVVKAAGDDHFSWVSRSSVAAAAAESVSSWAASSAAPRTPARTPCRATRIVVFLPRPGST